MNEEDLCPAAQEKLQELTPPIDCEGNWNYAYQNMLRELAEREIPELGDVQIKGQGLEAWERSREEHTVALELKAYAKAFLGPYISAEIAKLPETISLDDFLSTLMPNTASKGLHPKFKEFLEAWAKGCVEEQMKHHPRRLSKKKYAAKMAESRLMTLKRSELPSYLQYDLNEEFRTWFKSQDGRKAMAATNAARSAKKEEKMEKMLSLLPHTKRANETMSLGVWRTKAKEICDIPSSTFDKYRKELEPRYLEKPKLRFRVDKLKAPENK